MYVNTEVSYNGASHAITNSGPSKNKQLAQYLTSGTESFKGMADYSGKVDVKVKLENHWGLTANPINSRVTLKKSITLVAKPRRIP
jgi:hypothetical protein